MGYCTPEDVKKELYLPLLQQMRVRFPDEALDEYLADHIVSATDYVDSILSQSFPVPIQKDVAGKYPSVVRTAASKMAAFFALAVFSEQEDLFKDRREAATEMLDALVVAGRLPGQPQAIRRIQWGSQARKFTDSELARW